MRKIIKTAILMVLVIGILYFASHPEITGFVPKEQQSNIQIDKEVEKQLGEQETVEVVIFLKEKESGNKIQTDGKLHIENIKQNVKFSQEEFEKSSKIKAKNKYSTANAVVAEITAQELEDLKNSNDVEKIIIPEESELHLQESVPFMKIDSVHNASVNGISINGSGQTICIVDSGIDYTHPAFGSCTNDTFLSGSCQKVIGGYDFANNDADPMDDNGHGTRVAGIISAQNGITGIAPEAKIVALKACNSFGVCNGTAVMNALDWCVSNASLYNITVISMSLGRTNSDPGYCDDNIGLYEKPFIDSAVAGGISVVISSGNEGNTSFISAPSCLENATSVGAVYHFNASSVDYTICLDENITPNTIPCYSNSKSILDFVAPGSLINTTASGGGYDKSRSGTSYSAPHVSGIIALLNQYLNLTNNRKFSPSEIENLLKESGEYVTDQRNGLNFSKPDLLNAINNYVLTVNETEKSVANNYGKTIINTTGSLENASVAFRISNKSIILNSSQYPEFNVSANITFYNLGFVKTPIVLRDGIPCDNCLILGYDGNLTFFVPHFTNYSVTANSQLIIFDENDAEGGFLNKSNIENTLFFANYTNATDNLPINSGSTMCNITYSDNASDIFSMTFNVSNGLYYNAKNFSNPGNYEYNVNCSDNDYEPINLSDSITSLPGCGLPPPNIDWVIPENSTAECNNTILYFQNQTLITFANSTFILRNTTFFLNDTSESNEEIIINESSNFTLDNSVVISNISGKDFNLLMKGEGDLVNSTFNNSQPRFQGTQNHFIENSNFYDSVYFEEYTKNNISNSLFTSYAYFYNSSDNFIENSTFSYRFESYGNSRITIKNSTFNGEYLYARVNSIINFTLPRSTIVNSFRASDNATVYGYIDMPTAGGLTIPSTSQLNRFYPVLVNYTNGSPAVGKQVNITNDTLLWQGITDSEGIAYPNVTWNTTTGGLATKVNYTISTNPSDLIGVLTDTPIIFELDIFPPGLNVTLPQNNSYYNTTTITLNYTVWDDVAVDSCWYTNITGENETLSSCGNITFTSTEGFKNITVYVNDTSNNINSTQVFFTVDITAPVVNLENPANNTLITSTNNITFKYNVSDNIGIANATLIINNIVNKTNFTVALDTSQNFTIINMQNGQYNWSVIAYDNAGNYNTSVIYNLTINYLWCGDGSCNGGEDCGSCPGDCGSCSSSGGGSGGGGGGIIKPPVEPPPKEDPPGTKQEIVEASSSSAKAGIVEKPSPVSEIKKSGMLDNGAVTGIIYGLFGILIASLIWHLPLFYFYRRTFVDDYVIERFIREDKLRYYRKLFVTEEVHKKYKRKLEEEKKDCNLGPIHLYKSDEKFINHLIYQYHISTELAKLVTAARRGIIARIFTTEKVSDDLRKEFRKIKFENPFEYEK